MNITIEKQAKDYIFEILDDMVEEIKNGFIGDGLVNTVNPIRKLNETKSKILSIYKLVWGKKEVEKVFDYEKFARVLVEEMQKHLE